MIQSLLTVPRWIRLSTLLLAFGLLCATTTGCQALGVVASAIPPPTVMPRYNGLANQSVGVMVWADRGVRADWEDLRLQVATGVQAKMLKLQKDKKLEQLKGTTFP